jgi:putative Holliday junction resolvase
LTKFLGIDFGTKRVGIAISDELAMIASPLETIHAKDLITYLKKMQEMERITDVVIGLPVGLRGEQTDATQQVLDLEKHIRRTFPELKVHMADERFTSKMAGRAMIEGNLSKSKRREKGMIDKISAAIILQSFLDKA